MKEFVKEMKKIYEEVKGGNKKICRQKSEGAS